MSTATATLENTYVAPKVNPWIVGVVVSLAAFMEVLDTSIANVALPHIAGSLGASNDESTWVLTSYLVSNAIVLPITGWLTQVFGRKRFFLICIFLFTASSFLCGAAPSLGLLLLFRILQGAGGGGLQPMAQAILADTFPPKQRGLAFALYGVTAVCAPAIGPTLGGWITDSYTWRWIFYVNVPVGILALFLVQQLVENSPVDAKAHRGSLKFDYIGFSLLAIGIGALQVVLDKGQEDDWFGSHFIATLAVTAVVCLTALIVWEWLQKEPLIDIHLLKSFNFAASCAMFFVLGFVIFASTVVMPQMLQTLMGYTAEIAGLVLSGGSALLLLTLPLVGRLVSKYPAKYLIAFGWLTLSIGMFISTRQTDLLMSFGASSRLRIYQSIPIGFLFVPITLVAYIGLPKEKSNAAAGIVNFMRNVGGSVGTSMVSTMLARRSQFHQSVLAEHTRSLQFADAANTLGRRLNYGGIGQIDSHTNAIGRLAHMVQAQAQVLSYIDIYWVIALGTALMFFLSFFLRRNEPGAGGDVVVH
jgi:MFS transporter, DHA2 family, multidrug resistance protein